MLLTVIFILILFLYFDLLLLKKSNKELFFKKYYLPAWICILYGVLLSILIFNDNASEGILTILIILILPFHLVKRYKFRKANSILKREDSFFENRSLSMAIDSLGVLFYWFVGSLVIVFLYQLAVMIFPKLNIELAEILIITVGSSILIIYLMYRSTTKYPDLVFREVVGLCQNKQSFFKLIVLPIICGLLFAGISSQVIFSREVQPTTPLNEVLDSTNSSFALLCFLAVAVFWAPFFEEIIFRGYFFYAISHFLKPMTTILIISLSFAILHVPQYWGDWAAITMVSIIGLVLSLLRAWTGSTIPSMIAHYCYNGSLMIISALSQIH